MKLFWAFGGERGGRGGGRGGGEVVGEPGDRTRHLSRC